MIKKEMILPRSEDEGMTLQFKFNFKFNIELSLKVDLG